MKKAGRPRLPEEQKKSQRLNLRLLPDENKKVKRISKKMGLKKSEAIRYVINSYEV